MLFFLALFPPKNGRDRFCLSWWFKNDARSLSKSSFNFVRIHQAILRCQPLVSDPWWLRKIMEFPHRAFLYFQSMCYFYNISWIFYILFPHVSVLLLLLLIFLDFNVISIIQWFIGPIKQQLIVMSPVLRRLLCADELIN